ncbi:sulfurtransferase [Paenisporosarcina indica]|uniref:sulfurtransferase n=1 Tax=Paenisporosarcina indica TaxID=650093 RepID=UPI00094F9BBA|nr:sulfurtransferase [Paenisporosarcina indica]
MSNVWIAETQVDHENVRFVDTRFSLQDSTAGQTMYDNGHIENAVYLDLERDLSDMNRFEGRHPLPSKEQLKELFESNGFLYTDHIVIYDQGGMPFAPRAYWLFKYAGFPDVSILKEGYNQLKELGYNISTVKPTVNRSKLTLDWNVEILSDRQSVKLISEGVARGVLLDARSAERYEGINEPIDSIAGHIPTARNFDWEQLKNESTFKSSSEVQDLLQTVVSKEEEITVYCGSGVTAAPLYAMLKEVGYQRVKLYVGSYSDWITEHPIEK